MFKRRPWACIFGNHEWFTVHEEFRPHEGAMASEERCKQCGWERISQYGYTHVKRPWEMTVRKMKWDKEAQDYV